jgi:hypothetical protein
MAHPKTKMWINDFAARGETNQIVHQMPTPVMAPKTTVRSAKISVCDLK